MRPFFQPNIGNKGRVARGLCGVALFAGAWFALDLSVWLGLVLGVCGGFVLFEALRGWCVLRACRIRTKL
jgi:hypothetical protein